MAAAGLPEQVHASAEVLVATTWECPLECTYCFVRHRELPGSGLRMSPGLAARVVDALDEELAHVESICLHLYGGEPLANLPALEAMVARAGGKRPGRFRFAVTTSGVGAQARVFELLEAGRFQIVLSVDGPKKIHDECRRTANGAPTHTTVMRFLENVKGRTSCRVRGSAVVRPGWGLAQATDYLRTLPVDLVKAQAVRLPSDSPLALNVAERRCYMEDLYIIARDVISEVEEGRPPRDDRFSSRVLQLLKGGVRHSFCGAGYTNFGIAPDGTVMPCVLLGAPGDRLGHIDDEPAMWIHAGKHWRNGQKLRQECRKCAAFPLCGGGCPAVMPVCGKDECDLTRRNCEAAVAIFEHFRSEPVALLAMAGVV